MGEIRVYTDKFAYFKFADLFADYYPDKFADYLYPICKNCSRIYSRTDNIKKCSYFYYCM